MISDEEWIKLVSGLLGRPFKWGGRDSDGYDCWGIVCEVRKACGAKTLPEWADWIPCEESNFETVSMMEEKLAEGRWEKTRDPMPGDLVMMSTHKKIHHAGVVTPFGVLSTTRQLGVTVDSFERLSDMGYKRIECYRWVE